MVSCHHDQDPDQVSLSSTVTVHCPWGKQPPSGRDCAVWFHVCFVDRIKMLEWTWAPPPDYVWTVSAHRCHVSCRLDHDNWFDSDWKNIFVQTLLRCVHSERVWKLLAAGPKARSQGKHFPAFWANREFGKLRSGMCAEQEWVRPVASPAFTHPHGETARSRRSRTGRSGRWLCRRRGKGSLSPGTRGSGERCATARNLESGQRAAPLQNAFKRPLMHKVAHAWKPARTHTNFNRRQSQQQLSHRCSLTISSP